MTQILGVLDREWSSLADSPEARRALMRWAATHPVLADARTLDDVIELGWSTDTGPEVRNVLARLASSDEVAARTLLQGLLGGLCTMAKAISPHPDTVEELISLAWERIRTYPIHRRGSVSGNVLLDIRKWYWAAQRANEEPIGIAIDYCFDVEPSSEEEYFSHSLAGEVAQAVSSGAVSRRDLSLVLRSRVGGESMTALAAERNLSLRAAWHRRWRAETTLRELALAS